MSTKTDKYQSLVWHGKIIKKIESRMEDHRDCPEDHFICEIGCDFAGFVQIEACSKLFIEKTDLTISIPMEITIEGRTYNPAVENTPLSQFIQLVSRPGGRVICG